MEKVERRGGERVAVRVELEAFPLKAAPIPPCRLHSIAITSGTGNSFVLYVGTESGHVLRYILSTPIAVGSTTNSPSQSTPSQHAPSLPSIPTLSLPPSPTPLNGPLGAGSSIDIAAVITHEKSILDIPSSPLSLDKLQGSSYYQGGAVSSPTSVPPKSSGRSPNGALPAQSPSHSPLRQLFNPSPPHRRPSASRNAAPLPSSTSRKSGELLQPSVPYSSPISSIQSGNQSVSSGPTSSPSSPGSQGISFNSSPFISSSPQFSSLDVEYENGVIHSSEAPDAYPTSPSIRPASPMLSVSASLDLRAMSKPGLEMTLTGCRHVSKSPIEALCPLSECARVAILSEGHIALLGAESLDILDRLPATRGAVTMAKALASPKSSVLSTKDRVAEQQLGGSRALVVKRDSMNKLFGRGSMSTRLGGLMGGLGEAFSAGRGDLAGRKSSRFGGLEVPRAQTSRVAGPSGSHEGISSVKMIGRLAVALKKKILLFEIHPSEQERSDGREGLRRDDSNGSAAIKVRELTGIEGVITMAWLGDVIIAGTTHEYFLFSFTTGLPTHLFSLPQELSWRPLLKAFPKDQQALLLIDNAGIPVDTEGHPAGGSLQFHLIPDGIGFSPPYVLVVKQGVVEIYHHKTGSKMQLLSLTDAGKGRSLVADDDDGQLIVVANSYKVWCLRQVPLDEQLKELLKHKAYSDAVRLAEDGKADIGGEKSKTRLAMVHAEAGYLHLFDMHFKEAMDHFLLSDIMEPAELFPFFPSLTSRWRAMVPRKRYWGLHPPPQPMAMVIESGLLAIQSGLLEQTQLPGVDRSDTEDVYVGTKSGKDALVERYLTLAMQDVARYLYIAREKELKPAEKEGVDTLLMKLYNELHATSKLEELAAGPNSCVLEEVESLLRGAGQLRALALLYESKGLWSLALQVWQTLAQAPDCLSEGSMKDQARNLSSWQVAAAAAEATRLLEESSDSALVLQHLSWIIELDQNLALRVLTSSKRADPLPPEDALLILESHGGMVQQRYLVWLVQEQGMEDPHYHTELALSLAKSAWGSLKRNTDTMDEERSTSLSESHESGGRSIERYESEEDTDDLASAFSMRGNRRDQLLRFLESSNQYDAKIVLDHIRDSELWKEQFVLHRKLGDEMSALRTLALKLEDSESAEKYCAEIGRPEAYLELMDMYLHPGEGKEPMHRAAARLLHSHGACLDPLQLLEALSLEMPLGLASETIAQILVSRVHRHRQGQIVRQMVRKENLEARIARVEELSRHVCITSDNTCESCNARIGTKPFGLYPDDSIFCYKCLRQFGEHVRPVPHRKSDHRSN